jgi:hypothetical protein
MDVKTLYKGLQDGKRYILKSRFLLACELYANGTHRYFAPGAQLVKIDDADGSWIAWHHYGSSANKNTLEDLEWLLRVIFKKNAADFVELPELA